MRCSTARAPICYLASPTAATVVRVTSPPHAREAPPYRFSPRCTNGRAFAALVLAVVACVPLGLIFGLVTLVQTKNAKRSGGGLAIAGLVISVLSGAVGVVAACGHVLVTGTVQSSPLLRVGECFNETPQAAAPGAEVGSGINNPVGCDQPHSDEVVAVLSLSRFPTKDTDHDELTNRCRAELQRYSPSASRDPHVQVVMLTPDTSWKYMNNHTSGCLAHFAPDRVGSIKG
jgi:hypothetical protein